MGNAQFKDLPILGRALGSSTQVEAPLRGRSPPRVMTPGGTLQLPRPRGQPLRAGRNQQKSLPAHAPLNGLCLFLLFGGQVNADTDRSVARRHHTARRRLPHAGRGLRSCCGSRAKAFRCLPPPPPAATPQSRTAPNHPRPPSLPRALAAPAPPPADGSQTLCARVRVLAQGTARDGDPTTAPSSGSTHVEPTGPRGSPEPVSGARLRVQFSETLGAPTRLCPSQSFPHARVWQAGKPLRPRQRSQTSPDKAAGLPAPAREGGPPQRGREARGERLQAPGLGAVPAPGLSAGCRAGAAGGACTGRAPHPRFLHCRHPVAAAPQEGGPAARVAPHPRASRVRAPGPQKLPGWRRRDFWAAPPSPAATLRSLRSESPWRLGCSIQAGLPSTPAGRYSEAAPSARVPHSPFPVQGGVQSLHPGCSATAHGLLESAARRRS